MSMQPRKLNITAFTCIATTIGLFGFIVYRAVNLSFVHDESLSYTILRGRTEWLGTANNQWLSTVLAFIISRIFGYSELALRAANVLSFLVFARYCYGLLAAHLKTGLAIVAGFSFIVFNQFVLEYFSLFRGYGLAMACLAACLFYFTACSQDYRKNLLVKGLIAAVLTIYANYSFLVPVLSLELAFLALNARILFSVRSSRGEVLRSFIWQAVALLPTAYDIIQLKNNNQFYFGGDTGFMADTFQSVVQYSFTNVLYTHLIILKVLFFICLVAGTLFIKSSTSLRFITCTIILAIIFPVLMHALAGIKFSIERAAIYWTLLTGIYLACLLDAAFTNPKRFLAYPAVLSAFLIITGCAYSFSQTANGTHTTTWIYDANTKNMLQDLDKQRNNKREITLGINWLFEPSINYYREIKDYKWLDAVTRDGMLNQEHDYYFVFEEDVKTLPVGTQILKRYPLVKAVLLKRN